MKRGEIYYFNLGDNRGSELNKIRPCIIIQNNIGNKYSPTTIIAPITHQSKKRKRQPTQVELRGWMQREGFSKLDGVIQAEQVRTVDKSRLASPLAGMLSEKAMRKIDKALLVSIGLSSKYKKHLAI